MTRLLKAYDIDLSAKEWKLLIRSFPLRPCGESIYTDLFIFFGKAREAVNQKNYTEGFALALVPVLRGVRMECQVIRQKGALWLGWQFLRE